jgi:hypothetical protein
MSWKSLLHRCVVVSLLLFCKLHSFAQMSITGTTCGIAGTQYQYVIAGNWTNSTTMTWSISGSGTINGSSSGTPLPRIFVTWSGTGSRTVNVTTTTPTGSANLSVTLYQALVVGSITSGGSQAIISGTVPASITCATPTGGYCTPSYAYQWLSSPDQTTWTSVSGATGLTLNFGTTTLTQTMYYKLEVEEVNTSTIVYSSVATVLVYPTLVSGTISPSSQTINYGRVPAALTVSGTSGGTGTYSYVWKSASSSGGPFGPAAGTPSGTSFTPTALTSTTWFDVVTTSIANVTSGAVVVNVNPEVFPGTITPNNVTVSSGTSPGLLTATAATGGACSGSFGYQWQTAPDNTTWSNDSGADSLTYNPGNLSASEYYRVRVICGTDTEYTPSAYIQVGAVDSNLNYIRSRTLSKPGVTDTVTADGLTSTTDVQQTTTYFDGLGRPVQTVAKQASPASKDMVTIQTYDPYGRSATNYLPYTSPSNNGLYKTDPIGEQETFNSTQFPTDQYYYGQTAYEPSPLNRTSVSYAPGSSWVGANRGVSQQYAVNGTSDSVQNWTIASAAESLPVSVGLYAAGALYKNVSTDEAGHSVVQYTDLQGHMLLKKVQSGGITSSGPTGWLNTYYIYDTMSNLRFVIQPQAVLWLMANSWNFSASGGAQVAAGLCFRYEYDYRKRIGSECTLRRFRGRERCIWFMTSATGR